MLSPILMSFIGPLFAVIATVVPRPDPKRMRMDQILLGMTGMSLMAGTPAAEGASHGDGTQSGGGGGVVGRRQRFRLVRTVERRALEVGVDDGVDDGPLDIDPRQYSLEHKHPCIICNHAFWHVFLYLQFISESLKPEWVILMLYLT